MAFSTYTAQPPTEAASLLHVATTERKKERKREKERQKLSRLTVTMLAPAAPRGFEREPSAVTDTNKPAGSAGTLVRRNKNQRLAIKDGAAPPRITTPALPFDGTRSRCTPRATRTAGAVAELRSKYERIETVRRVNAREQPGSTRTRTAVGSSE